MDNKNIAVGLDIGTTKIVAMVGKEDAYGKIEVLGTGKARSLGVHRGVVNNITQTIQSIQEAVDQAEAASGEKIENVIVGIAGQHIRSLHHSDYITRPNSDKVIDEEDIENYLDEYECSVQSLRLVICEPVKLREVDFDYFCEELPEDGELPDDVFSALNELNKVIRKQEPVSWIPGKFAAVVKEM